MDFKLYIIHTSCSGISIGLVTTHRKQFRCIWYVEERRRAEESNVGPHNYEKDDVEETEEVPDGDGKKCNSHRGVVHPTYPAGDA